MFEKNQFLLVVLRTTVLSAVPFFVVDWLPMIDLPQHLAQAHLVGKVLSGDRPDMVINWLSPDTLTTWILALLLLAFPPLLAAKAMALGLITLSILGIALVAKKIGASSIVVPLSAALLFNQSFYWGFLPFFAGFAAFLFLIAVWFSLRKVSWRETVFLAALFLLVYFCHIFWFVVAIFFVTLSALIAPDRNVKLGTMIVAALPSAGLALFWYPLLRENLVKLGIGKPRVEGGHWDFSFFDRLHPDYLSYCISGLKSDFNIFLLFIVLVFILVGMGGAVLGKRRMASIPLFSLAVVLFVAFLILPDRYASVIVLSQRWLAYVLIFFLLGSFAPIRVAKRKTEILFFAFLTYGGYVLLTTYAWNNMEKNELSGLMESMEKLPLKQNVLGLNFIQQSSWINTPLPFSAHAAYAQTFKDCDINFSFADNPASLVTYKELPFRRPYQNALNLFSGRTRREDIRFFDFVLANGDQDVHNELPADFGITPVTDGGRWRLYKVVQAN